MEKVVKRYKYIFCLVNSLIGLYAVKFHYTILSPNGANYQVYLDKFKVTDILYFLAFLAIWIVFFYILDHFINKKRKKVEFKISNKKLFFISLIVLLILWSPYYLTFFPGGVYSDTLVQYIQATRKIDGHGYSVFYSLYIRLLYFICGKNSTWTFGAMTIIQLLIYLFTFSYFMVWLKNKKFSKKIIITCLIFFAINPRIPAYAISLWKDSLFSVFLFMYALNVIDIVHSNGKKLKEKYEPYLYGLLCILVSLFRNNGLYLVMIMSIILFIKYRKMFSNTKLFYFMNSVVLLVIYLVYGPLFGHLGYKPPYVENIGISLQQISYVVANDKKIDNKSQEYIDHLMTTYDIKDKFTPLTIDNIKKNPNFDSEYLVDHKVGYYQTYFRLMVRNPVSYLKAYSYITVGYWNYYTLGYGIGSDSLRDFYEYTMGKFVYGEDFDVSHNINVINKVFKINLWTPLSNLLSFMNNSAIGTLICFIGIYILLYKDKFKYILCYLPGLLIFACLMVGSPIAFSSRYIIYTIFFIPLALFIPFMEESKK